MLLTVDLCIIDRMDHHADVPGYSVPNMKHKPCDYLSGGRLYAPFDPGERTLPMVAQLMGDSQLVKVSASQFLRMICRP